MATIIAYQANVDEVWFERRGDGECWICCRMEHPLLPISGMFPENTHLMASAGLKLAISDPGPKPSVVRQPVSDNIRKMEIRLAELEANPPPGQPWSTDAHTDWLVEKSHLRQRLLIERYLEPLEARIEALEKHLGLLDLDAFVRQLGKQDENPSRDSHT